MQRAALIASPLLCLALSACPTSGADPSKAAPPLVDKPVAAEPAEEAPEATPAAADPDEAVAAVPPPAGLTVFEWGLLTYGWDGLELVSAPPKAAQAPGTRPRPPQPGLIEAPSPRPEPVARKPVIYFEVDGPWPEGRLLDVAITFPSEGSVREIWPTPNNGPQPTHGDRWTWEGLTLLPTPCAPGWAPGKDAPPCASLKDPEGCEAAELEAWVPSEPSCLSYGGVRAPALLYNGVPGDTRRPLTQDGPTAWRNATGHPIVNLFIPDRRTTGRGQRGMHFIPTLGPGEMVELSVETLEAGAKARTLATTREHLGALGLRERHVEDFMRAWGETLADPEAWTAFGFFSPEAVKTISTLETRPAAVNVYRAMAFTLAP